MTPSTQHRYEHWFGVTAGLLATVAAVGSWRAWQAWTTANPYTELAPAPADASPALANPAAPVWVVSEQALAATLVDELFPPPPPEQPPPPPPKLDVQLVAILGQSDNRRAFVRDLKENAYLELAAGGTIREQVLLESVEEDAAVFSVAGQSVRLELQR